MEKTCLIAIESFDVNGDVEWGLSFNGHNPDVDDYFKMTSKDELFRLINKLSSKYPPFSNSIKFNSVIKLPEKKELAFSDICICKSVDYPNEFTGYYDFTKCKWRIYPSTEIVEVSTWRYMIS